MLKEMHVHLYVKGLLFLYEDNQDSNGLMHPIDTSHCQGIYIYIYITAPILQQDN